MTLVTETINKMIDDRAREIVREMIKEGLRVEVQNTSQWGTEGNVLTVKLTFQGRDISEDETELPTT